MYLRGANWRRANTLVMNNFVKNTFRISIILILAIVVIGFFLAQPSVTEYCRVHYNPYNVGSAYQNCLEENSYKGTNSPFYLFTYFTFLLLSIFFPDLYIKPLRTRWTNTIEKIQKINNQDIKSKEIDELRPFPQFVGWVERFLFYAFLLVDFSQFTIFLGVWLTLKTVITYKHWDDEHEGRAKFYIFLIGNGLSILSVMGFFFLAKLIINR